MMTTAKFVFTAFIIVVATLWGSAQQANASSPHLGQDRGALSAYSNWRIRHGHRTTTHYSKHKHHH